MKRQIVLALAALLVLPALALSQETSAPARRLTVSPFLGYAFSYAQKGTARLTVFDQSGSQTAIGEYDRQVTGGIMPGVAVDYDLPGRWGASAAFAYNQRGDESVSLDYYDVAPLFTAGSALWLVRAAATMDLLQEESDLQIHHPVAQLYFGPAFMREVPAGGAGRPARNVLGLNGGANIELALPWKGFSARGTFEDYMSHGSNDNVAVQLGSDLSTQTGLTTVAQMTHGLTNMYVVRAGLSYTFQF